MLRKSTTLPVFILLAFTAALVGQEATTTTWKGTLDARGTKLRLEVDITESGEKLSGELRSLDQNNAKLEIDKIKLNEKSIGFSVPRIGATFSGRLSDSGTVAKGTFSQSGMNLKLTLNAGETQNKEPKKETDDVETLKEAWIGKLEMGIIKPTMQFRIVEATSGKTKAYFDSVTEGRTGFDADWSKEDGVLQFVVDSIELEFVGELNEAGTAAEGTWSQGGRSFPLKLNRKKVEAENKLVWANRPQRPIGPFPYDTEEVKFENSSDQLMLAGTLTLPKTKGPHPAVILISGSGPQDRDETLMEHKPFLVLADYLTRKGIAVLRYDDRGTAESTGNFKDATTRDFATDASAAVDFLKQHPEINEQEIGLVGHSEGGLIAPMVANMREDIGFVVLLAATGVDGKTIILSQTKAMGLAEGVDESEIELSVKTTAQMLELAGQGKLETGNAEVEKVIDGVLKTLETLPEDERESKEKMIRDNISASMETLNSPWMNFFVNYDPREAIEQMDCPVFAIIGSKDTQVIPELNVPEIRKALEKSGNQNFEIVELEGLNHLFQKCETGGMSEYASIDETFNVKALKQIGDWIRKQTTIRN